MKTEVLFITTHFFFSGWIYVLLGSTVTQLFIIMYILFLVFSNFARRLVLSNIYGHVPYSYAIDAETGSVEWICMYVSCGWGGWKFLRNVETD